jgi:hypothetical protein
MKTQLFGYLSVASMGLDSLWVMRVVFALAAISQCYASTTMWFNSTNIIPIGNGRLGAMMRGQLPIEQIVLNEVPFTIRFAPWSSGNCIIYRIVSGLDI